MAIVNYRNLRDVSIDIIVACLSESFADYFVQMPSDPEFWRVRFKNARVDQELSWGAFDQDKLVAFIINGIDIQDQVLTAFNTGTGVLPAYRGNQVVDKMYSYGMSELKKKGVKRCSLEVIDKNDRAIRVYERIGFQLNHKLQCYKGSLSVTKEVVIQEVLHKEVIESESNQNYSWDNTNETIAIAGDTYQTYKVFLKDQTKSIGYFIINPLNGYIAQLESKNHQWDYIFSGICQISKEIKINNIKDDRVQLLSYIEKIKLTNTINQIEMEMDIYEN